MPFKLLIIGSTISLVAGPSDFLWHEAFGVDGLLSPPHLALATGMLINSVAVVVGLARIVVHIPVPSAKQRLIKLVMIPAFAALWFTTTWYVYIFSLPFSNGENFQFNLNSSIAAIIAIVALPLLSSMIFLTASKTIGRFGAASTVAGLVVGVNVFANIVPTDGMIISSLPWYLMMAIIPAAMADIVLNNSSIKSRIGLRKSELIAGATLSSTFYIFNYPMLTWAFAIPLDMMFFFTTKASLLTVVISIILVLILHINHINNSDTLSLSHYSVFATRENSSDSLFIIHGIASGDVTNDSAVVWSRSNREAQMHVEYDTNSNFSKPKSTNVTALSNQTTDFTSHVKLEGLSSDTLYYYRVWFSTPHLSQANKTTPLTSDILRGSFRTSPDLSLASNKPISFIFAADLGGQKHCRQADKGGYYIFEKMKEISPDFFIANGDMIYAADKCPAQGPSDDWKNIPGNFSGIADPEINWTNTEEVHDIYLKHWQYNRADPFLKDFLQNTSMYSQWDDHEVINDFGALWPYWNSFNKDREGYPNIVNEGRKAFFDYSPINRNTVEKNRVYRSFSWGPNLDLFILDGRSYRSPNSMADTPENNKTMLGTEQVGWLEQGLMNSSAIWKVISSDIPIAVPTGANASILGRDGWANGNETNFSSETGFERELQQLLRFLDDSNIENVVFVTTDVHFPANILYDIDANNDGDKLIFHEIISGPLSAFRFGTPGGAPIPKLDTTFNPKILYEEGGIFNFGHVRVQKNPEDDLVHLTAQIVDDSGLTRPNSTLDLIPLQ